MELICTVPTRETFYRYYDIGGSCLRVEQYGDANVALPAFRGALAWARRRPGRQFDINARGAIRFYDA